VSLARGDRELVRDHQLADGPADRLDPAPMAGCDPELHYRLGVELFIAGVRAMADKLT
jgi:hypothetical protein